MRKSNKKVKIGKYTRPRVFFQLLTQGCLWSVPRLLFDGWSYQDYMSVLASEDEIEELGIELVKVAKVN